MTAVKYPKSSGKPTAERFWSVPFTPATSFITDISTWFARERGWISTAAWVSLLGALDIPAPSARTALHRMTKGSYLQRETRNGRPGYSLSKSFCEWIDTFGGVNEKDWADSDLTHEWVMVMFSIPEVRRAERHVMRTILGSLGFAPLGNGIWIASAARFSEAQQAIEAADFAEYVEIFLARHQGFSGTAELIQQCWDVDQLAGRYRTFIRDVQGRLTRKPGANGRTFADVVLTMNTWRRINIDDPRLPMSALPSGWPRTKAKDARDKLLARFYGPSRDYVEALHS